MRREQEKERARKRRHHKFRIRERARRYARHVYGYNEREYRHYPSSGPCREQAAPTRQEEIARLVEAQVQMSETRPQCSCWRCGNPRRYGASAVERLTMQELRSLDSMKG